MTSTDLRRRFAELHARDGVFLMPNPWDVGSAKLLAHAGFEALATTSAGLAWSLGKDDQDVTLDEVVEHTRRLTTAIGVPLNVDSERCYADDPDGIERTVRLLHEAGAAGCSIEDYDPTTGAIDEIELATERGTAAADAAHRGDDPMVLTARCENLLYSIDDLDDTIERLVAYRNAGADCLYAPGLATVEQIRTVVDAVDAPVNVLAWPNGPTVAEIAEAGARRVSVGGALASHAYASAMAGARELLDSGTTTFRSVSLRPDDRTALG